MKILRKAAAFLLSAAMALTMPVTAFAENYDAAASAAEEAYLSDNVLPSEAEASSKSEYTLMIYMCGSDLESDYGQATRDINEIIKGYTGKKVNIIIQTGGAKAWNYKGISAKKCQRYKVEKGKLKLVDNSLGQKNMTDKNTLSDFIKFCKNKYAAKRYGLIMWDHGGGSIIGYGGDQNYPDDSLELDEFYDALKKANTKFEFIGFDACLMSTLESALAVSKYTNYLAASEMVEPGDGWYYKKWVNTLCKNPSVDTKKLCKQIGSDTLKENERNNVEFNSDFSVIDTKKTVSQVLPALEGLAKAGKTMLANKQYASIANARYFMAIENNYYEMVDIGDLADAFGEMATAKKAAGKLKTAVKSAVVYQNNTDESINICGMSIAFPFDDLKNLDTLISIYEKTGYSTIYVDFLKYFANIMAGGQEYYFKNSKDKPDYSKCSWYNKKQFYADNYYKRYYLSDDTLELSWNGNEYVLPITDEQYKVISDITVNLWYNNSDSSLMYELGTDNTYDWDNDGNLIVDFRNNWTVIGDIFVPCKYWKTVTSGSLTEWWSYIPCYYNGEDAYLFVMWDNQDNSYPDNGKLMYWSPLDDDGIPQGKYICENGDKVQPYYYAEYNGEWYYDFTFSDTLITLDQDTRVSYSDTSVLYGSPIICMIITDIFNNEHYTEFVYY